MIERHFCDWARASAIALFGLFLTHAAIAAEEEYNLADADCVAEAVAKCNGPVSYKGALNSTAYRNLRDDMSPGSRFDNTLQPLCLLVAAAPPKACMRKIRPEEVLKAMLAVKTSQDAEVTQMVSVINTFSKQSQATIELLQQLRTQLEVQKKLIEILQKK